MGWFGRGEALQPPAVSAAALQVPGSSGAAAAEDRKTFQSLVTGATDTVVSRVTTQGTELANWACGVRERFYSLPDGEQALVWALGAALVYSRLPDPPPSEPEPEPEPEPVPERFRVWPGPYVALALVTTVQSANARWGFSDRFLSALRSTHTISIGSFLVVSPHQVQNTRQLHLLALCSAWIFARF
eukprot:COSAG02_NODE_7962_length_2771_cov_1.490269_2_plen_187_part_00